MFECCLHCCFCTLCKRSRCANSFSVVPFKQMLFSDTSQDVVKAPNGQCWILLLLLWLRPHIFRWCSIGTRRWWRPLSWKCYWPHSILFWCFSLDCLPNRWSTCWRVKKWKQEKEKTISFWVWCACLWNSGHRLEKERIGDTKKSFKSSKLVKQIQPQIFSLSHLLPCLPVNCPYLKTINTRHLLNPCH